MEKKRVGRWTKEDEDFMRDNLGVLTIAQMAETLNRNEETVERYIVSKFGKVVGDVRSARAPIRKHRIRQGLLESVVWKLLKDEFTQMELELFKEKYCSLMEQFDDVTASEESQVFQVAKFEILMHRTLVAKRQSIADVQRLENLREEYVAELNGSKPKAEQRQYLLGVEAQIQAARAAEQARTKEYNDLNKEHSSLLKTLKATRDQRFDEVESKRVSYIGLLKKLADREVREREGRSMELYRIATEKEEGRLGRPHKYMDGNEDLPILSADTIERESQRNLHDIAESGDEASE